VGSFFELPDALTKTAQEIDDLFMMIFWISLAVFILVEGLLAIFLIRYKRKHPDKQGLPIHGSTKAEVIWTLIPAIILVFIGVYSSGMVYTIQQPPADAYEIKVTGFKWAWEFNYPNGAKTINELHIPEGKDVLFTITSKDVIHSFWIPEFRMKQDAVPGRVTQFSVKAEDIGSSERVLKERIVCAEYCGNQHSKMLGNVTIQKPDEFEKWVAEEKVRKKTDGFEIAMDNGCLSCHTVDGGKSAGPSWKGLFGAERTLVNGQTVAVDAEYLKEAIVNPNAKVPEGFKAGMPPYSQLDEETINNIVKYIETLK